MKSTLIALALALTVAAPGVAGAQEVTSWTLDWQTRAVNPFFPPFDATISGVSPATLTPRPDITDFSTIVHPNGPVFDLQFTFNGQEFGGLVAQGNFQEPPGLFTVPFPAAPPAGGSINGTLDIEPNQLTADVFFGLGRSFAEWTATGTPRAAAAEPGFLGLGAAALALAVALVRRRRTTAT